LMIRRLPSSTLFPYTTLFRSGSVTAPSTYPNPNLKPEINTNIEAGMDFGLLGNRLNYNFTVYQNNTRNQIIRIPTLYETGYSHRSEEHTSELQSRENLVCRLL